MDLKTARRVCAKMEKNLGGEYQEALTTIGTYLSFLSDMTRRDKYQPTGFACPDILKEVHRAWPEADVPAPFDKNIRSR